MVLFTDELRFNVDFADGKVRVWQRKKERFEPENAIQRDRDPECHGLGWN